MNSIEILESVIVMLKKQGYRCTDIETEQGKVAVKGLIPLPPTPQEEAADANDMKQEADRYEENMRLLKLWEHPGIR